MPDVKRTVHCPYCDHANRLGSDSGNDYEGEKDVCLEQCESCTRWFVADWEFPPAICLARVIEGQMVPSKPGRKSKATRR